MPIRTFSSYVRSEELQPFELKDCPLVVDASNYFYRSYERSGLPYQTGAESDLYAAYLRKQLAGFQRARVDCYFVFKGGHENIKWKIEKVDRMSDGPREIRPIFMKEICIEIIQEMGFKTGVCEFESKAACVLLAKRLRCPILSDDIEFCFQPEPYIPSSTLAFTDDAIPCSVFNRATFLRKHGLREPQLALFRALTEERYFPFEFFHNIMWRNRISTSAYKRFPPLLAWLSRTSDAERQVVQGLSDEDRKRFQEVLAAALLLPGSTTAVDWLLGERKLPLFGEPDWVAGRVFTGRVSGVLLNLLHSRVLHGDWMSPEWPEAPYDALAPSLDTIQYTLDLLTDGDNDGFVFRPHGEEKFLKRTVAPPGNLSGQDTGLFEHWARERLGLSASSLERLDGLPRDAGLVVMSLLLCARAVPGWSRAHAYASLLRHVLGAREYAADDAQECTDRQQHALLAAQHALQQVEALRRLCTGVAKRWLDAGRATNAARALALFDLQGKPRQKVSLGLADEAEMLQEFDLLADTYEDLESPEARVEE